MLGKICSPLSRNSTALPPTMGAAAYASSVGKKEGSPSDSGGSEKWGVTFAHPSDAARRATHRTLHNRAQDRIKSPELESRPARPADGVGLGGASIADRSQHTAMRNALLVLLLAIANGGQPSSAPEPAAATMQGAATPDAVRGAWAGEWAEPGARGPIAVEASFTTAAARKVI